MANFHGDRSRELGENLAKEKKKHHEQNRRPPVLTYGWPNQCNIRNQFTSVNHQQQCSINKRSSTDRLPKKKQKLTRRRVHCLHPRGDVSSTFYSTVTLNFDLLTPESEGLISIRKCISAISLVKISLSLIVLTMFCVNGRPGHHASCHTTWGGPAEASNKHSKCIHILQILISLKSELTCDA